MRASALSPVAHRHRLFILLCSRPPVSIAPTPLIGTGWFYFVTDLLVANGVRISWVTMRLTLPETQSHSSGILTNTFETAALVCVQSYVWGKICACQWWCKEVTLTKESHTALAKLTHGSVTYSPILSPKRLIPAAFTTGPYPSLVWGLTDQPSGV